MKIQAFKLTPKKAVFFLTALSALSGFAWAQDAFSTRIKEVEQYLAYKDANVYAKAYGFKKMPARYEKRLTSQAQSRIAAEQQNKAVLSQSYGARGAYETFLYEDLVFLMDYSFTHGLPQADALKFAKILKTYANDNLWRYCQNGVSEECAQTAQMLTYTGKLYAELSDDAAKQKAAGFILKHMREAWCYDNSLPVVQSGAAGLLTLGGAGDEAFKSFMKDSTTICSVGSTAADLAEAAFSLGEIATKEVINASSSGARYLTKESLRYQYPLNQKGQVYYGQYFEDSQNTVYANSLEIIGKLLVDAGRTDLLSAVAKGTPLSAPVLTGALEAGAWKNSVIRQQSAAQDWWDLNEPSQRRVRSIAAGKPQAVDAAKIERYKKVKTALVVAETVDMTGAVFAGAVTAGAKLTRIMSKNLIRTVRAAKPKPVLNASGQYALFSDEAYRAQAAAQNAPKAAVRVKKPSAAPKQNTPELNFDVTKPNPAQPYEFKPAWQQADDLADDLVDGDPWLTVDYMQRAGLDPKGTSVEALAKNMEAFNATAPVTINPVPSAPVVRPVVPVKQVVPAAAPKAAAISFPGRITGQWMKSLRISSKEDFKYILNKIHERVKNGLEKASSVSNRCKGCSPWQTRSAEWQEGYKYLRSLCTEPSVCRQMDAFMHNGGVPPVFR